MNIKKTGYMILLLLVVLTVFGCKASSSESNELGDEGLIQENIKTVVVNDTGGSQKVFAIVYPISHPFFTATTDGAEDAARIGGHELLVFGPTDFDVNKQIEIMEKLIDRGVDGIGIGATDSIALKPSIDKAIELGISVVTFDTDSPLSNRLSFIGTDNKLQGQETGKVVAKLINEKGKVLVSMGVPSQLNLRLRLEGLMEELANYPDIEIIDIQSGNGNPKQTTENIAIMVKEHPEFDILVGIDAQAGPSAVPIWEDMFLSQYLVVPEDMSITIQGVKDGIVTACITQEQYEWGRLVIEKLNAASNGEELKSKYSTGTVEINYDNVFDKYPD